MDSQRTYDPVIYVNQFFKTTDIPESIQQMSKTYDTWCKEAFDIIQPCQDGLQIGSGPNLIVSGYASRKVSNIILTEYTTDCFKLIQSWMDKQKNQYKIDWSKQLEIIAKLEGTNENVDARLRKALVGCLKIDLRKDQIFQYPIFKKFDIIYSQLSVECAATSDTHYKKIFGNLKKYLKINGYLLLIGILQETHYIVGQKTLPTYPITKQLIKQAVDENGYEIIKFQCFYRESTDIVYGDWKGLYFLLARLSGKIGE